MSAVSAGDAGSPPGHGGHCLSFVLAEQEYMIGIHGVQEIVGMLPITPLPEAAPHVCGIVNLRGRVITILDLRARLGLPRLDDSSGSCIVVTRTRGAEVGLLVDAVTEVVDVRHDALVPLPDVGDHRDYLLGVARTADGEGVRLLLDVDRLLGAGTVPQLAT